MENAYGIGINNRYALFIDDEDADPLDILAQASKEKLAVKAKKIEEATKPAPKTVKKEAVTKNDNSGEFCLSVLSATALSTMPPANSALHAFNYLILPIS